MHVEIRTEPLAAFVSLVYRESLNNQLLSTTADRGIGMFIGVLFALKKRKIITKLTDRE